MDAKKVLRTLIATFFLLGALNCGSSGTAPGEGPSFSSVTPALSAYSIFRAVSKGVCDPVTMGTSGDQTCEGGGTIHVEAINTDTELSARCTFSKCVTSVLLSPNNQTVELEANGTAWQEEGKSGLRTISESLYQHVSYSGDLGFAADCDLLVKTPEGEEPSVSGSCVYRDSDGEELAITPLEIIEQSFPSS